MTQRRIWEVSTTMHGFNLMEFSLYPKKKWLEENNYNYHYIYVSLLVRAIVVKKIIEY